MKRLSGLKLLAEREGEGKSAQRGDRVLYNTRIFLNRGDEIPLNEIQAKHLPAALVRVADGTTFIDHTIMVGRRRAMASVEHALLAMKVGGYRKVRASPHLAYRDKGIPDLIPPDAGLMCEIWLREIIPLVS